MKFIESKKITSIVRVLAVGVAFGLVTGLMGYPDEMTYECDGLQLGDICDDGLGLCNEDAFRGERYCDHSLAADNSNDEFQDTSSVDYNYPDEGLDSFEEEIVDPIEELIGTGNDEFDDPTLEDPTLTAKCAGGEKGCTGGKKNMVWHCQTNGQTTDTSSTLKRCCRASVGANCTWQ